MCRRFVASLGALAVVVVTMALPLAGQTPVAKKTKSWTPPHTPDGQPDLQGVWMRNTATPLAPKELEGRQFLTDDEVTELRKRADRIFKDGRSDFAGNADAIFQAAWTNVDTYKNPNATGSSLQMIVREFENRTSLIVDPPDGKIPPLTPEAREKRAAVLAAIQRLPVGPEDLDDGKRCITYGVPRLGTRYAQADLSYFQILQSPGYVVLTIMEMIHEARIIPLDGHPHLPGSVRQWNGDPRGRWEGDTLVVDTTNFSSESHLTGSFNAPSNFMESLVNLHLVERFTRVAADTIKYEFTLDDSTTWTKPWTAEIRLKQTQDKIYEYACHEGNYSMDGILAGARAEEKTVAQAVTKGSN